MSLFDVWFWFTAYIFLCFNVSYLIIFDWQGLFKSLFIILLSFVPYGMAYNFWQDYKKKKEYDSFINNIGRM